MPRFIFLLSFFKTQTPWEAKHRADVSQGVLATLGQSEEEEETESQMKASAQHLLPPQLTPTRPLFVLFSAFYMAPVTFSPDELKDRKLQGHSLLSPVPSPRWGKLAI